MFRRIGLATAIALLAGAPAAQAVFILPPAATVGGQTREQLATTAVQLTLGVPAGQSISDDPTGAQAFRGDLGGVIVLGGAGGDVTRSLTLVENQALFLPLITAFTNDLTVDPSFGPGDAGLRADVAAFLGTVSNLAVSLNGVAVPPPGGLGLADYLLTPAAVFTLSAPPGSIAGDFFGPNPNLGNTFTYRTAVQGVYVGLAGLTPGNYTLQFSGGSTPTGIYANDGGLSRTITYNLTVTPVPVPPTAVLAGLGVVAAGVGRRRLRV